MNNLCKKGLHENGIGGGDRQSGIHSDHTPVLGAGLEISTCLRRQKSKQMYSSVKRKSRGTAYRAGA